MCFLDASIRAENHGLNNFGFTRLDSVILRALLARLRARRDDLRFAVLALAAELDDDVDELAHFSQLVLLEGMDKEDRRAKTGEGEQSWWIGLENLREVGGIFICSSILSNFGTLQ